MALYVYSPAVFALLKALLFEIFANVHLKDIARLAGFTDEHEFYRTFHSHTGMTASAYRKHHIFEDFRDVYWKWHRTANEPLASGKRAKENVGE